MRTQLRCWSTNYYHTEWMQMMILLFLGTHVIWHEFIMYMEDVPVFMVAPEIVV